MEDWVSTLERRLWSLQYSMLRQLEQHQQETRDLVERSSGAEQLRLEVGLGSCSFSW